MIEPSDFKRLLTHPIKPTGGPEVLLVTLEDTAEFIGPVEPWRQARPYWDRCASEILKAARTGKRSDIVEATRSLEVALRRENWLRDAGEMFPNRGVAAGERPIAFKESPGPDANLERLTRLV